MILDILTSLLAVPTPTGYPSQFLDIVSKYIPYEWSVETDAARNVYCTRGKDTYKLTVMVEGHYDEIGLMVNYISPDGYLYCRPVGNAPINAFSGRKLTALHCKESFIVISGMSPRLANATTERKDWTSFWIDPGCNRGKIVIGDYIVLMHDPFIYGDNVVSPGIDNKGAVAAMLNSMVHLDKCNDIRLCFCFSAAEETGMKNIRDSIKKMEPDILISLDATFASDVPDMSIQMFGKVILGGGPVILYDPCCDRMLIDHAIEILDACKTPYQPYVNVAPARGLNITESVSCRQVGFMLPCRNMHSAIETCSLSDIEYISRLLTTFIISLDNAGKY